MIDTESQDVAVDARPSLSATLQQWMPVLEKLVYPAALLASLSIWFLAIRAPLWLDETLSYWQVSGGFAKVWARSALMPSSIGYLYTLWFAKSILGTSEIALKIPSTIALLAAVYLLFCAARRLFGQEVAFLACVFFILQINVVFAATDARPYAFALLALTLATDLLLRWVAHPRMCLSLSFGATAAGILYFHYLFATTLPAFVIYYLTARGRSIKQDLRHLAAGLASFTLCCVPLMYRIAGLYHSREIHIVPELLHPVLSALNTLAPKPILIGFAAAAFVAALVRKIRLPERHSFPAILIGPLMALVPAGILFALSTATPMHLIIPRYFTVVAPGSALTWALLAACIDSRVLRQFLCIGLAGTAVFWAYSSPAGSWHEVNFKDAHALVNAELAKEDAIVLECSGFIESNYESLPSDRNDESALISQLYYYPVNAPVIMLPISLNDETVRISNEALSQAVRRHQKVILVAGGNSYQTLDWLANYTRGAFTPRVIGKFEGVLVAEFRLIGVD